MKYDKWQSDSLEYPLIEWLQELKRLQNEIQHKIDNCKENIYLIDPEGLHAPWNKHYLNNPWKKRKIIGLYSPYYSKMLFHPTNPKTRTIDMHNFI